MSAINIPDEVRATGFAAFAAAVQGGHDGPQIYAQTIAVTAPLIVAAELERLADDVPRVYFGEEDTQRVFDEGVDHVVTRIRARASELRGEGAGADGIKCTCTYGAVAPGVVEPPTTDPDCPQHAAWHNTRFGPPSNHAGTYEGCLACESRQRTYAPLLHPEPSTLDPDSATALPMDGRCEP